MGRYADSMPQSFTSAADIDETGELDRWDRCKLGLLSSLTVPASSVTQWADWRSVGRIVLWLPDAVKNEESAETVTRYYVRVALVGSTPIGIIGLPLCGLGQWCGCIGSRRGRATAQSRRESFPRSADEYWHRRVRSACSKLAQYTSSR